MNLKTIGFEPRAACHIKDDNTILHNDSPHRVLSSTYKYMSTQDSYTDNPNWQRIMGNRGRSFFDQTFPDDKRIMVWVGYSKWLWSAVAAIAVAGMVARLMNPALGSALSLVAFGSMLCMYIWEQHVRQVPRPVATIVFSLNSIMNAVAFYLKVGSL